MKLGQRLDLRLPCVIVLVLELLLEKDNVHDAVQSRDDAHYQDLGDVRQLGDDGRRYKDQHGKAAEVGGKEASVGRQDGSIRLCGGRV